MVNGTREWRKEAVCSSLVAVFSFPSKFPSQPHHALGLSHELFRHFYLLGVPGARANQDNQVKARALCAPPKGDHRMPFKQDLSVAKPVTTTSTPSLLRQDRSFVVNSFTHEQRWLLPLKEAPAWTELVSSVM